MAGEKKAHDDLRKCIKDAKGDALKLAACQKAFTDAGFAAPQGGKVFVTPDGETTFMTTNGGKVFGGGKAV